MTKNITYLLGAGASYNACPILNEQGEKMIELAQTCPDFRNEKFIKKPENFDSNLDKVLWYIGYFGKKAKELGTIDTYARKLYLNNSFPELEELKIAVSLFFTVWQLTDDEKLKTLENRSISEIDNRYISLFATILERNNYKIVMKDNINFVTWNYDLQLEYAFKLFTNNIDWDDLSNYLMFEFKGAYELKICHLNGYHGYYKTSESSKETDFLDRTESKNINDILNKIGFINESNNKGSIDISGHINYAWEKSDLTLKTREEAKRIFKQTDILIIIGYSFPNFNKEIDKSLFKELEGRKTEIYYQDPNATDEFISELFNTISAKIHPKKEINQFFLPYSF
ncbi:MAG: hypothetical protein JEY97_09140 [Bacteroidales bacterium]|nr:hypothetical protein [Bacteroidales bacterium]